MVNALVIVYANAKMLTAAAHAKTSANAAAHHAAKMFANAPIAKVHVVTPAHVLPVNAAEKPRRIVRSNTQI